MADRQTFNLLNRYGRANFFRRGVLGDEWARRFVLGDTLGRFICAVIGHGKTFKASHGDGWHYDVVCSRCGKVVGLGVCRRNDALVEMFKNRKG
jgi:hypothetical protein